jgi:hypothetical protein
MDLPDLAVTDVEGEQHVLAAEPQQRCCLSVGVDRAYGTDREVPAQRPEESDDLVDGSRPAGWWK